MTTKNKIHRVPQCLTPRRNWDPILKREGPGDQYLDTQCAVCSRTFIQVWSLHKCQCLLTPRTIEELYTERPARSSSFWLPRNLSNHMDWQTRTGDTMSVKSREMSQTLPWWWGGGRRGKTTENKIHWSPLTQSATQCRKFHQNLTSLAQRFLRFSDRLL